MRKGAIVSNCSNAISDAAATAIIDPMLGMNLATKTIRASVTAKSTPSDFSIAKAATALMALVSVLIHI